MDETQFNAAFEAKLAEVTKRKQAEAEEAECLRIANEPAERERAEATTTLRQGLRDLGRMFVEKADELNIPPNIKSQPKQGIVEQWSKRDISSFGNNDPGTSISIYRDGNILARIPQYLPGTSEVVIGCYSTAVPSSYEGNDVNLTPLKWYGSFSADTMNQAEQTIGLFTTAAVDFLSEMVVEQAARR